MEEKRVATIILVFLICFSLVYAAENDITITPSSSTPSSSNDNMGIPHPSNSIDNNEATETPNSSELPTTVDDTKETAKDIASDLKGATWFDFNFKGETVPSIMVPDSIGDPLKFILGLKDKESLSLEKFIILVSILVMTFVVFFSLLEMIPFFEQDWTRIVGGIAITLLVSLTGIINKVLNFTYDVTNFKNWLGQIGPLRIIFTILAVALLIWFLPILRRWLKNSIIKNDADKLHHALEDAEQIPKIAEAATNSKSNS